MADDRAFPKWAAAYLYLQAAGVSAWWAMIIAAPDSRRPFFALDDHRLFLMPDMIVFCILGAITATGVAGNARWARFTLWALAGGGLYATALDFMYAFSTGIGWHGPAFMLPTVIVPGYLCRRTLK